MNRLKKIEPPHRNEGALFVRMKPTKPDFY